MPRAFDTEARLRVIQKMRTGGNLTIAAEAAGFSVATVKRHMKEDPAFAQEITDAINYGDGEMQVTLREVLIREENVPGMFRWLESRQAQDFGQKKLVVNQHVGPGGGPIQVAVATTDQLRELLGDPDYRDKMLAVVNDLPMIEATATEDG